MGEDKSEGSSFMKPANVSYHPCLSESDRQGLLTDVCFLQVVVLAAVLV